MILSQVVARLELPAPDPKPSKPLVFRYSIT
jgi:hypothetical protein